jgi:hypothetical protein
VRRLRLVDGLCATDAVEVDGAGDGVAEAFVESDSSVVGLGDVKEAAQAGRGMDPHEVLDERGGVASAGVRGVGADGGDLAVSGEGEALAGHGDELAIDLDAEVAAEDVGARSEVAGEGYVGEADHGGGVGSVELADCRGLGVRRFGCGRLGVHLPARQVEVWFEAGDGRDGFAGNDDGLAGGEEVPESGEAGFVPYGCAGEGDYVGGEAARGGGAYRDACVLGDEGVPERVGEDFFGFEGGGQSFANITGNLQM